MATVVAVGADLVHAHETLAAAAGAGNGRRGGNGGHGASGASGAAGAAGRSAAITVLQRLGGRTVGGGSL